MARRCDPPPSVRQTIDALRARGWLQLLERISTLRGVALEQLCGSARTRSVAHARQEVWWHIRHHPERFYSLPEIARLFGRDHTTILAGIAAHEQRLNQQQGDNVQR